MLYLIRHSQAGPRGNYDELSALGQQQAQQLGRYFRQQQLRFDAIYTGTLQRQQQTAAIVQEHLPTSTEILVDARWNEFKLGEVYKSISLSLCAESEAFARDFAEMKTMLHRNAYAMGGAVARCDRAVMRAWLENRYPVLDCETWPDFRQRIQDVFIELAQHDARETIAIFTSATPIAIAAGISLQLTDAKTMELTWVMYNSGLTTLRQRDGAWTLYALNATPHLWDEKLKTFR